MLSAFFAATHQWQNFGCKSSTGTTQPKTPHRHHYNPTCPAQLLGAYIQHPSSWPHQQVDIKPKISTSHYNTRPARSILTSLNAQPPQLQQLKPQYSNSHQFARSLPNMLPHTWAWAPPLQSRPTSTCFTQPYARACRGCTAAHVPFITRSR